MSVVWYKYSIIILLPGKGIEKDPERALKCFKWAIKSYEREGDVRAFAEKYFKKEPDRISQEMWKYFNAYRMVIKLGDKTVVRELKTLAQSGETEATNILTEFGI